MVTDVTVSVSRSASAGDSPPDTLLDTPATDAPLGRPGRAEHLSRRRALAAVTACLVSFAAFWAAQRAAGVSMIDLMVYRAEGRTVLDGGDLYAMRVTHAHLPATYPPFAALLFTVLTLPGVPVLRALATAANLLLLVVFVRLCLRVVVPHATRGRAWTITLWSAALAVWCEPVWTTLRYGQINLLLAVAVVWDLSRRAGHRWAGAGIGLAAAVKLTPALFAAVALLTGLVRAGEALRTGGGRRAPGPGGPWLRLAATATAVFAVAGGVGAALLPHDSLRFWTGVLFEADRAGHAEDVANQSLRGVLARLPDVAHGAGSWAEGRAWVWPVTAAVVAAAGLATAVAAARREDRAGALVCCAATALLISPVSWSHHWVWCVPVVLFLAVRAGPPWAVAAGLVFCSYALWWPVPGTGGLGGVPGGEPVGDIVRPALAALYPLTALALLLYVARASPGRAYVTQAVANV